MSTPTRTLLSIMIVGILIVIGTYEVSKRIVGTMLDNLVYITVQYEGSEIITNNKVKDKGNGYFVELEDGSTVYVLVSGKKGNLTHTETLMTDKTTELNAMLSESIRRKNEKPKENPTIMPIFIPI